MREWCVSRWNYFRKCWESAQSHVLVTVVAVAAAIYSFVVEYGPVIALGKWADVSHWPKLPPVVVLIIVLVGALFIVTEGGYRLNQEWQRKAQLSVGPYPELIADFVFSPLHEIGIMVTNVSGSTANNVGITIDSHKWRIDFRVAPHIIVGEKHPFVPHKYIFFPGIEFSDTERTLGAVLRAEGVQKIPVSISFEDNNGNSHAVPFSIDVGHTFGKSQIFKNGPPKPHGI